MPPTVNGDIHPWKQRLLKRILPLAILGIILALVANHIVRSLPSDIELVLSFPAEIEQRLNCVELSVEEEGKESPITTVIFHFDPSQESANQMKHDLRLLHGNYKLHFKVDCIGVETPLVAMRTLTVSADAVVTVQLPSCFD